MTTACLVTHLLRTAALQHSVQHYCSSPCDSAALQGSTTLARRASIGEQLVKGAMPTATAWTA
jgi:hypothetical protein